MNRSSWLPNMPLALCVAWFASGLAGCDQRGTAPPTTQAGTDEALHADREDGHRAERRDSEDEEIIKLTAEQIERAGIGLETAGAAEIREDLSLYGVIAPNAERVRQVTARFAGAIRRVDKRVGDRVRHGETLAIVESNESLQDYALVAPIEGIITARDANPGEQTGERALFTVADLSSVWVELSLFPRDVAKVRVGQAVRVKNPDTGSSAEGKVVYVAPFGASSNQTLIARVQLDNSQGHWPPGLYVAADVLLSTTAVPVAVANSALQTLAAGPVVFVREGEAFAARPVRLGRGDGASSEVLAGLAPGERYATSNSFVLKAELGKDQAEHGH